MASNELRRRRHLLITMLTACAWRDTPAGPAPLVGMARQSYDLQLTRYGEDRGHSVTSAVGSAWEREPWIGVQRAAWESLRRRETDEAA